MASVFLLFVRFLLVNWLSVPIRTNKHAVFGDMNLSEERFSVLCIVNYNNECIALPRELHTNGAKDNYNSANLGQHYDLYTSSWSAVTHYFNQSNHGIIENNVQSKIKNNFDSFTTSHVDVISPMFKGEIWTIPECINDLIWINAGNGLCESAGFGLTLSQIFTAVVVVVLVSQLNLPAVVLETH